MIADHIFEYDAIEEEDGSTLFAESVPWRGLVEELEALHDIFLKVPNNFEDNLRVW